MSDYLPTAYTGFRDSYPDVAAALDRLGAATDDVGPLSAQSTRLVKLGIAAGALSEGAVRSNVRKALDAGVEPDEIRHVGLLVITTVGFPAAIAVLGWIEDVLSAA